MSLPKYEFFGVPTWEESVRGLLQPLFEAPTLSDVPSQYVNATFEIIAAMILVILSHLLLIPIVRATLPRGKSFIELLDLYMHVIFLCLIVILSTLGTFLTSGSQEDRIRSYNVYTVTYLSLYIAKSIIHVPILFLSPNCTRKSFIQYMLHHMLSVVGYTVGLYTRRMHFYGCLNGLCEISALFLNIVLTWRFFEKERGVLYAVLGVFLWISYLVTRIFLFPIWLCLFYGEVFFGPYADTLSAMELYFFPLTTLLLFLLSIIWFAPITRGFFKAVRGAMGSDRKKEDERLSTSLPKSMLEKKKD